MATLTDYKGLQVISGSPSGAGGLAINDDLKLLVDWNPKSNWTATSPPTSSDDSSSSKDYQVGSLWLNTDSGGVFVCVDATASAAIWRGVSVGVTGLTAKVTTTDATAGLLLLPGSNRLEIPDATTWAFTITTVARRTDSTNNSAVWETRGAIKCDTSGAGAELIGANITKEWKDSGLESWGLSVTAGNTPVKNLEILATGVASETIEWSASVQLKSLLT